MRRLGAAQWIAAGLVALGLHAALLVASEARLYGDVSPPAGPAIESAASLAGIIGAAVEVDAEEAPEKEVVEQPVEEIVEVQEAKPIELAATAPLVIEEVIPQAPEIPAVETLQETPPEEEIKPVAQPKPREQQARPRPKVTEKPQPRKETRRVAKPKTTARRGNSERGSAGTSAGGRGGRSSASAGAISAYAAQVRARILARRPSGSGAKGTTVIRFGISTGGGLRFASIARSSGNSALDARALAAVRGASFPPPPAGASASQLNFSIPFNFR